MKNYKLAEINATNDVVTISLTPKRASDQIQFDAGQYAAIGFKTRLGRPSPLRCFSMTSSPSRPDKLQFSMRISGNFTHSVAQLPVGTGFNLLGPYGSFTVDDEADSNLVLIAGGIGITPIMSIIRQQSERTNPIPITLLYSYRTGHDIPYLDELRALEERNPYLRVYIFVTTRTPAPEQPRMLSGKIAEQHIKQVVGGAYAGSTYFVCGPIGFMTGIHGLLIDHGVDEEDIITEAFTESSKDPIGQGLSPQKLTYAFATVILLVGIVGITALDLIRYIPRYEDTAVTKTSTTTQSANTGSSTGSSTAAGSSTAGSSTSSTPVQTPTYQAPTSQVS